MGPPAAQPSCGSARRPRNSEKAEPQGFCPTAMRNWIAKSSGSGGNGFVWLMFFSGGGGFSQKERFWGGCVGLCLITYISRGNQVGFCGFFGGRGICAWSGGRSQFSLCENQDLPQQKMKIVGRNRASGAAIPWFRQAVAQL